ncbi:MAG: OPT/YSL family transporter [Phycisphaerae bacterium]|nr:OPT/YSL family transporter [Phycisphaerae bacterium]
MADQPQMPTKFPENAYRELKPGEKYVPMIPPDMTVPEVTSRAIVFGLLMNIVFSVAATFLALKAGQGIETAIPISILAVGLSGFLLKTGGRASSILENVYVLAISTTSGYVAGGTCFTMPAIYILELNKPEHLHIGNLSLFLQIALVPFIGAILGALFLIPFRRYFVKEMHGKLPFPEATATNEILVTGASGSTSQAWILIYSFILSALYTFVATGFKLFSDVFTTGRAELHAVGKKAVEVLAFGDEGLFAALTTKVKAVFTMGAGAYFLGLGFIIGLRYASIICAGSFLSVLAITPMLGRLDFETLDRLNPAFEAKDGPAEATARFSFPASAMAVLDDLVATGEAPEGEETDEAKAAREARRDGLSTQLAAMFPEEYQIEEPAKVELTVEQAGKRWRFEDERRGWIIKTGEEGLQVHAADPTAHDVWFQIPRIIGIGAIFTAGLLSILKMGKVIVTALRQALGGLLSGKGSMVASDRTDEDISYPTMMILGLSAVVVMAVFFRFVVFDGMANPLWLTFISVILALVIAFLFTTVSAWAIAMISVTPISGMTVTTIIITAVLMMWAGLEKGDGSMLAVLLVGGVVCTALSMAGGLVTNFKLGYWLGASPKRITWNAIAGSLVSAIFVCGTIMVLSYKPGYVGDDPLPAPQANMMAGALKSFLGTGDVPWLLYGIGVVVALTVELLGISALAFGLGMYLPMYINTPILIGAFVAMLVKKSTKDEKLSKARSNKGILLASGLIAGGAIMEVLVNLTGALDDLFLDKAIMTFLDISGHLLDGGTDPAALARVENWLGLILFLALCVFVYFDCRRAKPELGEGELG